MTPSLDARLREIVREEVEAAVADALDGVDLEPETTEPETWASRVWTVDGETRLQLDQVGEALDCSSRQVRRYIAGETKHPPLPAVDSVGGKAVRAVDLRRWMEDCEQAERFRQASGGAA